MRIMNAALILAWIALAGSGCGRGGGTSAESGSGSTSSSSTSTSESSSSESPQSGSDFESSSGAILDQLSSSATIQCGAHQCHRSVGVLFSAFKSPEGRDYIAGERCTASLVGPSLAITNAHCIPHDIRIEGASCTLRMRLRLPAVGGYEEETLECDRVEFATVFVEGTGGMNVFSSPDIAVIRLAAPSSRPPLRVSRSGPLQERQLTVQTMDGEAVGGQILGRSLRCAPRYLTDEMIRENGLPVALRHGRAALTLLMDGCPVRSGNSGSPVLNGAGQIIGLVNSGRELGSSGPVAIASNFACMPISASGLGNRPLGLTPQPNRRICPGPHLDR